MQTFVARLYDVTILDALRFHLLLGHSPQVISPANFKGDPYHNSRKAYCQENMRSLNVFARRTGFAKGATAMTGYHDIQPDGAVTMGITEVDTFRGNIANWVDTNLP